MKFDKNIPAPKKGPGQVKKYPFAEMEVGDSVFYPGENTDSLVYRASSRYGRRYGRSFSGRTQDGGLRIWRVA